MNYDWWLDRQLWEYDQERLDSEDQEDLDSDEFPCDVSC
jgi:hypothetical protein